MSSFNFDPLRNKIEGFRQRRREQAGLVYKALFVKMAVLICAALALLSLILVARIRKVDGAVGWAEPPIVVLSTSLISVVFLVLVCCDTDELHHQFEQITTKRPIIAYAFAIPMIVILTLPVAYFPHSTAVWPLPMVWFLVSSFCAGKLCDGSENHNGYDEEAAAAISPTRTTQRRESSFGGGVGGGGGGNLHGGLMARWSAAVWRTLALLGVGAVPLVFYRITNCRDAGFPANDDISSFFSSMVAKCIETQPRLRALWWLGFVLFLCHTVTIVGDGLRRHYNANISHRHVSSPLDSVFNGHTAPLILSACFVTFFCVGLLLSLGGAIMLVDAFGPPQNGDKDEEQERRKRINGVNCLCSGAMMLTACLLVERLTPSKRRKLFRFLAGSGESGGTEDGGGGGGGSSSGDKEQRGGAFVAELVDSARVERGMQWWVHRTKDDKDGEQFTNPLDHRRNWRRGIVVEVHSSSFSVCLARQLPQTGLAMAFGLSRRQPGGGGGGGGGGGAAGLGLGALTRRRRSSGDASIAAAAAAARAEVSRPARHSLSAFNPNLKRGSSFLNLKLKSATAKAAPVTPEFDENKNMRRIQSSPSMMKIAKSQEMKRRPVMRKTSSVMTPSETLEPAAPKKKELIFVPNRCGSLRASELLRSATRNMRCIEWDERIWSLLLIRSPTAEEKAMLPEDLNTLSRPVEEGEKIDFFLSHSWYDDADAKMEVLESVVERFKHKHHGKTPTFWLDKVCIDQKNISDGLKVLPINLMTSKKILVLLGDTYVQRLWCVWELLTVYFLSESEDELRTRIDIEPIATDVADASNLRVSQHASESLVPSSSPPLTSNSFSGGQRQRQDQSRRRSSDSMAEGLARAKAAKTLKNFSMSMARCYDPNEEARLRKVIEAVGTEEFEDTVHHFSTMLAAHKKQNRLSIARRMSLPPLAHSKSQGVAKPSVAEAAGKRKSLRKSVSDTSSLDSSGVHEENELSPRMTAEQPPRPQPQQRRSHDLMKVEPGSFAVEKRRNSEGEIPAAKITRPYRALFPQVNSEEANSPRGTSLDSSPPSEAEEANSPRGTSLDSSPPSEALGTSLNSHSPASVRPPSEAPGTSLDGVFVFDDGRDL